MKKLINEIISILTAEYPNPVIALHYDGVFQLLVAVILSAQCTDERVNMVTPGLFGRFGTAVEMAGAGQSEVEKLIFSTGFYRNKARNIIGAARKIVEEYGGVVPDSMEELLKLPGVARKTANVVLWSFYGKSEGIVVDTHVMRLSKRLGLVSGSVGKNAEKVERELMKVIPKEYWGTLPHLLILHGRALCKARKPLCGECPLAGICPSAFI